MYTFERMCGCGYILYAQINDWSFAYVVMQNDLFGGFCFFIWFVSRVYVRVCSLLFVFMGVYLHILVCDIDMFTL